MRTVLFWAIKQQILDQWRCDQEIVPKYRLQITTSHHAIAQNSTVLVLVT